MAVEKVGARLKSERERLGLTQAQMAERCGVALRTYAYYESDARLPGSDFFMRAHAVGVDIALVMNVDRDQVMPDPVMPASLVQEAVIAVREAEIEASAFLQPTPLWVAIQNTVQLGHLMNGGHLGFARQRVRELLAMQFESNKRRKK